MQTQALNDLASVLVKPDTSVRFALPSVDNPWLAAAGAVGHALGIDIHPPKVQIASPAAIATASRIHIRQVQLEPGWWQADLGPLLGSMDQHPVALLPIRPGRYQIFDPQLQRHIPLTATQAQQIDPIAYILYRSFPDRVMRGWDVLKFALRGQQSALLTIAGSGLIMALLGVLTPVATGLLIDQAIPNSDRNLLFQLGAGLLLASLGIVVFQRVQRVALLRFQNSLDTATQSALWDRLLKLQPAFFRNYTSGDLKNRVLAISQIRHRLGGATLSTFLTGLFALLNGGILFVYNARLALLAMALALISFVITNLIRLPISHKFRALKQLEGDLFGTMVQIMEGIAKIRVAGAEHRAFAYWASQYRQRLKLTLDSQRLEDYLRVFNQTLPSLSLILFFIAVASLQTTEVGATNTLSTGAFLAFNTAFGMFIGGTTDLSEALLQLLEAGILWERTQPILQAEPEVNNTKAHPGELTGHLFLDRVTFRYCADGPLILDRITLEAKPGEFIAIVGPSGSGKSTLLRLMLGFEWPESGGVFYDHQALSGLDVAAVRRQLGVVLQNGHINSGSIFDNIAAGSLATRQDVWQAARLAGLAEDIEAMPMGLHTHVSAAGANLSGGQRQRLLIARALILQPKILLLDEATSALDNCTQATVRQNLEQLKITRVAIAHRLSTIRHADRIYVLDKGQIIQQGSFEELSQQPGLFQVLMSRQLT
ncbi:NHLP bacteriocin export ABC transporter permease/ATPase subunit [Leptothoe spongobia TAU-MAC 1115]|uniref:NHLP bacteriocin export ABC transporter permease/ATPase subunit n=1 Tax=Leptothoe spongobia TAU-MAC 1115 TaxID=1967444 RepID=A0A947DFI7_9CYAN|nr:NHLP bacteriocin export ABC transporter permease/ATPase subunit [Leptothoe spongobia TAU-MAC 1115]